MSLSSGIILDILNGETPDRPIFQVLNAKKIESANTTDRYRVLLSDGQYSYSHVMLAAQLNRIMANNEVTPNTLIEATKYMCNTLQGERRIIIILELKIIQKGEEVGERLGNPVLLNPSQLPSSMPTTDGPANVDIKPVLPAATPVKPPVATGTAFGNANRSNVPGQMNQNNSTLKGSNKESTPPTPTSRVHQIDSLTPYQNRWRIRARVTMKSGIRTWSNSRGEGRLFNVNLLDESGEIRCTAFNEQVDKYYNMLEVNKIYYISRCSLKTANKQYSNLNNDYEMTMNSETLIEPCNDGVALPTITFDFVKISELEKCKPNSNIDVIGVVKVCNDVSTVVGKQSQKEITKRDLQIVDQSGVAVNLTLWGDDALKFDGQGFPVISVKGARVSDFGGRSLSVSGSSQMMVNPDIKEAHLLRGWFEIEGRGQTFSTFQGEGGSSGGQSTNWKTFGQAKTENLGQGDKADYYTGKGSIIFVRKENCMYQACPTAECNKKVVDQGNGLYRCEKCNKEFPNYKWRMILSANIADHTDNQWVTCFQESAECVLGIKADELGALRTDDETQFDHVMQEALFKQYVFRLRAKVETYGDESRLKTVCVSATPLDWKEYGQHLTEQLTKLGI